MAGNQTTDIGQLTKILTIAVIITLILVAVVGILFAFKMISGDGGSSESSTTTPTPDESATVIQPTYTEQTPDNTHNYDTQSSSKIEIKIPEDNSADDSAEMVGNFVPDDPAFSPPEFNTTVADYSLSMEYYQLLYEKEQTLKFDSMSIIVTVGKGPLLLSYDVSNFLVTEGSGTGSTQDEKYTDSSSKTIEGLPYENPYYSFLNINVTNNKTGEVVATGGFGREFPSTEEQFLKIPMTGDFRIDIYGSGLHLDLKILSGTVPENPDAIKIDANMKDKYISIDSNPTGTGSVPDEYEEMW